MVYVMLTNKKWNGTNSIAVHLFNVYIRRYVALDPQHAAQLDSPQIDEINLFNRPETRREWRGPHPRSEDVRCFKAPMIASCISNILRTHTQVREPSKGHTACLLHALSFPAKETACSLFRDFFYLFINTYKLLPPLL